MSNPEKTSETQSGRQSLEASRKSAPAEAHADPNKAKEADQPAAAPVDYSALGLPNLLVKVQHEKAKVDMRVQDYWGRTGTIRWVGKLEKKNHPPNKDPGHYVAVEYDEPSANALRCNGTWDGVKYFTCDEKKGLFLKPVDLYEEVNPKAIQILREYFSERVESWHDFELIKFSIARSFEMNKVVEMLDKHLKWREEFQPSAEEFYPQTIKDDYPAGYTGTTDYDENLIYCERPSNAGKCHPSEFVRKYTLPVIARWHASGMEMGIQRMRNSDYAHKRVCYVVDLLNVKALTRPMIGFAQTLASVEQDNYPENLGRVFIVNCPTFFRWAWKLIKIFVDARTNKKIHFMAPGSAVKGMKEVMPEEEIPNFCGGTSNKWMETNGGILGSTDPSKAYKGELKNTGAEEFEKDIESGEGEFETIPEGDFPSDSVEDPSPGTSTVGSPNTTASPNGPSEGK